MSRVSKFRNFHKIRNSFHFFRNCVASKIHSINKNNGWPDFRKRKAMAVKLLNEISRKSEGVRDASGIVGRKLESLALWTCLLKVQEIPVPSVYRGKQWYVEVLSHTSTHLVIWEFSRNLLEFWTVSFQNPEFTAFFNGPDHIGWIVRPCEKKKKRM